MDEAARKKLLDEYSATKSPEIREKLILEFAPLVTIVSNDSLLAPFSIIDFTKSNATTLS